MMMCTPAIIVHGGAGKWSSIPKDKRDKAEKVLMDSVEVGLEILLKGGASVEAVVEAISVMEESGIFNAGRGSVPNSEGYLEMDAGLMDGKSLDVGAVASLRGIATPIRVAFLVMKKTPHIMLSGDGAIKFAKENGFKIEQELIEPRNLPSKKISTRSDWRGDTVGAVAVDSYCYTSAGASTGGIIGKMPGRVGDTPIPGAGYYANHFAAASATGIGELIAILGITRKIVEEASLLGSIELSGGTLMTYVESKFKRNTFGVIGLDIRGGRLAIYNTESMPYAYKKVGMDSVSIGGFP